jgi:hypothetical protein
MIYLRCVSLYIFYISLNVKCHCQLVMSHVVQNVPNVVKEDDGDRLH